MEERTVSIRVPDEFHKEIKVRIAQKGMTLKEYLVDLIQKDLDAQKK